MKIFNKIMHYDKTLINMSENKKSLVKTNLYFDLLNAFLWGL